MIGLISKNKDVFFYFINKKVDIQIFDLSDLKINIISNRSIKKTTSRIKTRNTGKNIWVFGGSTSDIACRKTNSTSWANEYQKITGDKVFNFAKSGRNTDFSIKILQSELEKKNVIYPDIIFWANYVNELDVLFTGLDLNKEKLNIKHDINYSANKRLLFLKRLDLTFYENFVSYFFLKEISNRLVNYHVIKKPTKVISDNSVAIKNYNLNTIKALKLAKNVNADFFIVTLFTKKDFLNETSDFGKKFFFPNIKKLLNDYSDIYWIDTRIEIQKIDNYEDLFCDRIHFTEKGNKVVAEVIKKIIDLKN